MKKVLLITIQGCKVIDLTNMASGIYSCILRCGSFVKTEKLVITK